MRVLALVVMLLAGAAQANTATSVRPAPREAIAAPAPARTVVLASNETRSAPARSLRPIQRKSATTQRRTNSFGEQLKRAFQGKPKPAPKGTTAKGNARVAKGLQGSVCGNPAIRGAAISRIKGRVRGCGLDNGVKITEVSGVRLTQHPTIDCNTAQALNAWVDKGVKPIVGKRGGGVKSITVVAHYACRSRNSQKGTRISEHGKGRAVDVAAINLNDGSSMTVLNGWRSKQNGPALKAMHKAACGPFGTVLGPNSDRFHQDHFHFDTARYRSGTFCR